MKTDTSLLVGSTMECADSALMKPLVVFLILSDSISGKGRQSLHT